MSLPGDALSISPLIAPLLWPGNVVRSTELEDFELGGVALQDPSQGLQVQAWRGNIDPDTLVCTLTPLVSGPPVAIFTETTPDPREFSFAFDSNMRYTTATRWDDGTMLLRWYDTSIGAYTITTYTDIQSVMLSLDDKRTVASSYRDVIFTYIKPDNKLYYRQQRDRYTIERVLDPSLQSNLRIAQFGMGNNLRMQWRLEFRKVL